MPGKSQTPALRFAGFSEEWVERKLGEIVSPYSDPVPTPTNGYVRLGIRSYAKGTFHSYVAPGKQLETAQMHRVAADKLIVNITFAWEHAVAVTTGGDSGKLVSHRFPQFSFNEGMVPLFFSYSVRDANFRHHLTLSSPGGAGRNRVLKVPKMLEYKFSFPLSEEQSAIGRFFRKVDALITQQQKKVEKLQGLKKGLMKKMFPRGGRTLPEVRFAGFDEEWVERKFQDIFLYERPENYIVKSSKYSDDFTMPVLTANKSFILGYTDEKSPYTAESLIFDDFTLECRYVDFPYMLKSSAIKILTLRDNKRDSLFFSIAVPQR